MNLLQAIFGILSFVAISWLISEQRRNVDWRIIVVGLTLQFVIAIIMFQVPAIQDALSGLNAMVISLVNATEAGTSFVFGYLGANPSAANSYPFQVTDGNSTFILAFRVLPLILFFTVLSALLWHFRILPWVIKGFAFALKRLLGVGGAVGVSTAANIFLGMVEAPILIRPYLARLTRSELFMVMTCGMATVAGSVMVLYSMLLANVIENVLAHILTASVISAPAALMIAKIMVPGDSNTEGGDIADSITYLGGMDAISRGTTDGLRLLVNVGAMLFVLVSLVALVNAILSLLPTLAGNPVTLEGMLGYLFFPVVFLMGIPIDECLVAGSLMGSKTILNELFAYIQLANLAPEALSDRSRLILIYAICGFANLGSLGIMIGGIGGMCPERRAEIVALAPKSLISGTLATCMTGALVGILY